LEACWERSVGGTRRSACRFDRDLADGVSLSLSFNPTEAYIDDFSNRIKTRVHSVAQCLWLFLALFSLSLSFRLGVTDLCYTDAALVLAAPGTSQAQRRLGRQSRLAGSPSQRTPASTGRDPPGGLRARPLPRLSGSLAAALRLAAAPSSLLQCGTSLSHW
jgi:hypothetical protein